MLKSDVLVPKIATILAFVVLFAGRVNASAIQATPVAQTGDTGSVTGTVADATGAIIAGATVIVTNNSTGQSMTTKTDSAGNFTISNFPVGLTTIKVTAGGFQVLLLKGVLISAGQAATQHITLPVAGTTTEVMAEANPGLGQSKAATQVAPAQVVPPIACTDKLRLDPAAVQPRATTHRLRVGNAGRVRNRNSVCLGSQRDTVCSSVPCVAARGDG